MTERPLVELRLRSRIPADELEEKIGKVSCGIRRVRLSSCMPRAGWKHSPEARAKMSATRRGRKLSEAHRAAIARGQQSEKARAARVRVGEARRGVKRGGKTERERSLGRYGLTPVEFDALLLAQEGVCAICRKPEKNGRNLSVDHCHETDRVRGLLCSACNIWLGVVERSLQEGLLEPMLSYLAAS